MVCTTIRPTTIKYPEFQTWQGCAKFVADHLTYEVLENPIVLVSNKIYYKKQKKKRGSIIFFFLMSKHKRIITSIKK